MLYHAIMQSIFCLRYPQADPTPTHIPAELLDLLVVQKPPGGTETQLEINNLDKAVNFYFQQGLATSTQKAYASAQKRYSDFCTLHHLQLLPASEQQVCKFVCYLAETKLSHSSIKVYLSALRQLHIANDFADPRIGDMPKIGASSVWN